MNNEKKQPKNLARETLFKSNVVKDGLRNAASHHVESFNYGMGTCLPRINQYMFTSEVCPQEGSGAPFKKLTMWFENLELRTPQKSGKNEAMGKDKMYPYECRLRSLTYAAPLMATVARKFDDEPEERVTLCLGEIPVMVRSQFCNLHKLSEEELVKHREDCFEFGGYFIINGNERIVRMLIQTKRNYPIAF